MMAAKVKKKRRKPDRENYHLPVRTEAEQFEGLPEELMEAWHCLRRFLVGLGDQSTHTSHRSIMFNRRTCYAFVRPKKSFIELCFFLPEAVASEFIRKVEAVSKTKFVHVMKVTHADQVEEPFTDWLRRAYEFAA